MPLYHKWKLSIHSFCMHFFTVNLFYMLLLFVFIHTCAQAQSLTLINRIPLKSEVITTDKTGNLYIASNTSIYKFSAQGDSLGFYNGLRNGVVSSIDASNPMQILVSYLDQNKVTILDRLLVEKLQLDLKKVGIFNATCIANSADGDIWVFDAFNNNLLKISDKLQIKNTSINFLQLFSEAIHPIYLAEQDRNLFVVDSTAGIIKLDAFGNYLNTYHFKAKEIQFGNNQMVYFTDNKLFIYNTQQIGERQIALPNAEQIKQVRVEGRLAYIRYTDYIDIFSL